MNNTEIIIRRCEKVSDSLGHLLTDMQKHFFRLEREALCLIAERKPLDIPQGQTGITDAGLRGLGLEFSDTGSCYMASAGRLVFRCRVSGEWSLTLEPILGGSVASFRRLQSIEEVSLLLQLLGMGVKK